VRKRQFQWIIWAVALFYGQGLTGGRSQNADPLMNMDTAVIATEHNLLAVAERRQFLFSGDQTAKISADKFRKRRMALAMGFQVVTHYRIMMIHRYFFPSF
jgi:hypothetical protein